MISLRRWLLAAIFLLPSVAAAHNMPYTAVVLDLDHDAVDAELILPLQELELSFGRPLLPAPDQVVTKYGDSLKQYVLAHVYPASPEGKPWTVEVKGMEVKLNEQPLDLTVRLIMHPPEGAPLRRFNLGYDVIVHEVASHKAFIFVRNDRDNPSALSTNDLPPLESAIGLIRYLVYTVPIDRPAPPRS